MSKKKLEKVLEYLVLGKDDKAKELLHNIFIEKARAIHEDLMNMDDDADIEHDDMDGFHRDMEDECDDLNSFSDEIEAEETMAEDEGMDVEMHGDDMDDADVMDMGDEDMADDEEETDMMGMDDFGDDDEGADHDAADLEGDVDVGAIESSMSDLEDALAQLKAEFEKLEAEDNAGEAEEFSDEEAADDAEEDAEDAEEDAEEAEDDAEDAEDDAEDDAEEEEMDESWLAEFDDLEESVSLEKVAMPSGEGEVGEGHYAPVETNKKSPVAGAPGSVLGAKPVKTGEGPTKSGYNRETAPSVKGELPHTGDNRRKKATDKMSKVSKEGDSSAKLNKGTSEGFGEPNKTSPLSKSPRK